MHSISYILAKTIVADRVRQAEHHAEPWRGGARGSRFGLVLALVLAAVATLVVAAPSWAATRTVGFDELPDGSTVAAGTVIRSQYPGVTFPDAASPHTIAMNAATHSPPNALTSSLPCSYEPQGPGCPAHRLPMNFSPPVSQVSLYSGKVVPSELGGTWGRLVGYSGPNGTGSVVATSFNPAVNTPDFELGPRVSTFMSMTAFSGRADIGSAVLYVGAGTGQGDPSQPEPATIDHLTFTDDDSQAPPDGGPPSVTLTTPSDGSFFQAPEYAALTGRISAPAGIDRFCVFVGEAADVPADCQNIAFVIGRDGGFSNVPARGLRPGRNTVTAWLRDTRGRIATAVVHVGIAEVGSGIDLRANSMEVTQGSQVLGLPGPALTLTQEPGVATHPSAAYNGVKLAAGGQTAVRVYANAASLGSLTTPARNVRMYLYGFAQSASGLTSLGAPLNPLNGTHDLRVGTAVVGTAERLDRNAYTFVLPSAWTSGTIRLVAVVNPTGYPTIPEANRANNAFGVTDIAFTPMRDTYLTPIELTHQAFTARDGTRVPAATSGPAVADAFSAAVATTPLGADQFHILPYAATGIDVTAILRCDDDDRRNNRCSDRSGPSAGANQYNDLLDVVNAWRTNNDHQGKVFALGYDIGGVTESGDQYALADLGRTAGTQRPLSSVNHELGHMFGLAHSSYLCGGGTGGQVSDPTYPDQYGMLGGFAFDRRTFTPFGGPGTLEDPLTPAAPSVDAAGTVSEANNRIPFTDLMTYCWVYQGDPATWLGPTNWNHVVDGLKVGGPLGGFGPERTRASLARSAAGGRTALRVSASMPRTGPASVLRVEHPQDAALTPADRSSTVHVVVRDATGAVVTDLPVALREVHSDRPPMVSDYVDAVVPGAGADSVEIVRAGTVVARRQRSAHTPTVKLLEPRAGARVRGAGAMRMTWHSADADGDPLTARVDYSSDGGRRWRTLALDVSGRGATLPKRLLSASRRAKVRVTVSDGFNETTSVSGAFRTAGAAPTVLITTPSKTIAASSTASLIFAGEAYDDALHQLPDSALTWYDGRRRLGRGSVVSVRGLHAGSRVITLHARDRYGRRAAARVTVKVTATKPGFAVLDAPSSLRARARSVRLRVASDVAATLRASGRSFQVGTAPRTLTVPLRGSGARARLPLKLTANGAATVTSLTIRRR